MRKTAILVIANLLWVVPMAQANEVARIQSAPGQSQSAWNATAEYQAFQCPAGTARGEGVDMNFTTTRSDDYHFAYCVEIIQPRPTPTSDTATATTVTPSPTLTATPAPTTPSEEPAASTNTSTSVLTETSTVTANTTPSVAPTAAFDYQAFLQMFIAWFQSWFAQFLASWSVMNR